MRRRHATIAGIVIGLGGPVASASADPSPWAGSTPASRRANWDNLQAKLRSVPAGDAMLGVRDVRTALLKGDSRSFLVPASGSTASVRKIVPQSLDPGIQTRQQIEERTVVEQLDQVVPANLMHSQQTAQLAVTVKRIRTKTLWDVLSGWIVPLVTAVLAVGVAVVFPPAAVLVACAAAAALAAEALGGWLMAHPGFRSATLPAANPLMLTATYADQERSREASNIAAAVSGAELSGIAAADGAAVADFDRVKGGFVFTDVKQDVPYTFMVVTPLEDLPFEGTKAVTTRQIQTVPDPGPLPAGLETVQTSAIAGYAERDYAHYLDPSGLLSAVQDGQRQERPEDCQATQSTPVNRGITITFAATGSSALRIDPSPIVLKTAGLLTETYGTGTLSTAQTLTEAVLPPATPYDFENRISLDSDVLVVHRRQKRLGWPGCKCGQFACSCWSEPYGGIERRTFTIQAPDRGSYYDSGVDPARIDVYYLTFGDKPLGAQVDYLSSHLPASTRTQVLASAPVDLERTVWRARFQYGLYDALRPSRLYDQPSQSGSVPASWGHARVMQAGSWAYRSPRDIPAACSSASARPSPDPLEPNPARFTERPDPIRNRIPAGMAGQLAGAIGRPLAFSGGHRQGQSKALPQHWIARALAGTNLARHKPHVGHTIVANSAPKERRK